MAAKDVRPARFDALREAVSERTSVALVGLPGSGRRAALHRARLALEEDGWSVTALRGVAGSRPLEALVLAGLVPSPGPAVTSVALEHLTAKVVNRRSVLMIEDVDELDDASAAVVGAVVAQHDVVVAASLRPPYPGAHSVDRVLVGRRSTVLWLPPLPFDDVHRIVVENLGADVEPDIVERAYTLSGGLPGLARAIVSEARRAGHLVRVDARWTSRGDLWTPALAAPVSRLLAGLEPAQLAAAQTLAMLDATDLATLRQLVRWPDVVALDDRGLLRFVESEGRLLVALFPPLVREHLSQTGHSARGRVASERIDAVLTTRHGELPLDRRHAPGSTVSEPRASSPESASVLGQLLHERARTRALVSRDVWERENTAMATVTYLDALLAAGAKPDAIDEVLDTVVSTAATQPGQAAVVRGWQAAYLGLVRRDVEGALEVLDEARSLAPSARSYFDGIEQYLRLVVADFPAPDLAQVSATFADLLDGAPTRSGDGASDAPEVILDFPTIVNKHIDASLLIVLAQLELTCGQVVTALKTLESAARPLGPEVPPASPRHDADTLFSLAMLCSGDVEGAINRSRARLEAAQRNLNQDQIEPHGYVVGLGLLLQGKLRSLSAHLTSMFALGVHSPLRPAPRAGLLNLGAVVSAMEQNPSTARSMAAQVAAYGLRGGPYPMSRPGPGAATVAITSGVTPHEATAEPWANAADLADQGFVLAATIDASWLADLAVDAKRALAVAASATASEGTLLPLLGAYLEARVSGEPDELLDVASRMRAEGLHLHATLAHAAAVRALRTARDPSLVAVERSLLKHLEAMHGELDALLPWLAAARGLTPREVEIAKLLAGGLTNREIAARLVLSERTVGNHVYRVFRKLGITSRDQMGDVL